MICAFQVAADYWKNFVKVNARFWYWKFTVILKFIAIKGYDRAEVTALLYQYPRFALIYTGSGCTAQPFPTVDLNATSLPVLRKPRTTSFSVPKKLIQGWSGAVSPWTGTYNRLFLTVLFFLDRVDVEWKNLSNVSFGRRESQSK